MGCEYINFNITYLFWDRSFFYFIEIHLQLGDSCLMLREKKIHEFRLDTYFFSQHFCYIPIYSFHIMLLFFILICCHYATITVLRNLTAIFDKWLYGQQRKPCIVFRFVVVTMMNSRAFILPFFSNEKKRYFFWIVYYLNLGIIFFHQFHYLC